MKLLLDQNVSRKLIPHLERGFPGSSHVWLLDMARWTDSDIWYYARQHGFTLVTKNTDMVDLCVLRGAPPHIVWLRVGNCSTAEMREVLDRNEGRIRQLEGSTRVVLSLFRLSTVE